MLTTLRIKNFALVDDLTVDFQPGFNVITGETGAGKSILIGALKLVLGERADRTLIRTGSDSCSVEAVFDTATLRAPLAAFLEANGLEPCEEHQLVLKRAFTAAGANRQFVNGSPTTLATLTTIGDWLVDIHGPHDHQSLLHPAKQLAILDAFGKLEPQRAAFTKLVLQRAALAAEKAALIVDEKTYAQQLDLLRFQVHEITAARLQDGEEAQVEHDLQRASNAAKLLQLSQSALAILSDDENSLLAQAGAVGRQLQELQRVDAAAAPLLAAHEQAVSLLRDLRGELSRYTERVDVNPAQLHALEERSNLLHSLRRKYGGTAAEITAFGQAAQHQLASLEQRDVELARLNAAWQPLENDLLRAGKELSAERRKIIPKLVKAVVKQLADLGFNQSKFEVTLASGALTHSGQDVADFQFAPNPGEASRPLRAIASSGEMARVMLALKSVLAAEDEVPVLIFDEVDSNVAGVTVHAVANKLCQIAQQRQVLCITHLPSVAAAATTHFSASKHLEANRTVSRLTQLQYPERVDEITRMLGGVGPAVRKHAEELLK